MLTFEQHNYTIQIYQSPFIGHGLTNESYRTSICFSLDFLSYLTKFLDCVLLPPLLGHPNPAH
jgi:hypothetical protein